MEVLAKAQTLVVEHAFTISMVLVALVLLAGVAWFSMSRSVTRSPELENKARVNEASTLQANPPSQESPMPTQEQQEEMARARAQLESDANSVSE